MIRSHELATGMPVFLVKDKVGDIEDDMQWYEMAYEIIMSSVIRKIFGYIIGDGQTTQLCGD